MNVDLMQDVIDYIEEHPNEYFAVDWAGCFAGHTVRIHDKVDPRNMTGQQISDRAQELLGLSTEEADELFIDIGAYGWENAVAYAKKLIAK